jgi:hypothetical protein
VEFVASHQAGKLNLTALSRPLQLSGT